jgi:TolB-like protein/lipopolysaccharide biosynthesis regulator YciM
MSEFRIGAPIPRYYWAAPGDDMAKTGFFGELRRRGVFRVAAVYIIAAWLVIQVADVFFPAWNVPEVALRYLLTAAILGFPIALVFGWLYDITPEGIQRTPDADVADQPSELRRADYVTLAILGIAALLIFYSISSNIMDVAQDRGAIVAQSEKRANSVAVMPFVNVSDDPSNDFFCDGISEEILHRLAEYRDMHVIARNSSFAFKGTGLDAASISNKLGVRFLLQGSVRKAGGLLRISAELVDEKNFQIWNQTFDRELTDVFSIQSEIATAVAMSLASEVLQSRVGGTEYEPDIDAYQHYLAGREYLRTRTPDYQSNAIEQFEAAIEIDSTYAAPQAGLGIAYILSSDPTNYADRFEKAAASIARALELSPESAMAHAAQGLLFISNRDPVGAEHSLRKAIQLDPNVVGARVWLGNALYVQQKYDESFREKELALAMDPLEPRLAAGVAEQYAARGYFEKAEKQFLRMRELPQPSQFAYSGLFFLYDNYSRHVEMISAAKQWILAFVQPGSEAYNFYPYLAYAYGRVGMFDEADYWLTRAEGAPTVNVGTAARRAYTLLLQGKYEEGSRVIDTALDAEGVELTRVAPFIRRVAGAVQIVSGRYERGVALLEPVLEIVDDFDIDNTDIDFIQILAYAHRRLGNESRADEIQEALDRHFERREASGTGRDPASLLSAAQNHVMAGRHESALAALELAVESGLRRYYWVAQDKRWDVVRDDPRFQSLLATMKSGIAEQRAEIQAIEEKEDFKKILGGRL